jgi:hypothetical protein
VLNYGTRIFCEKSVFRRARCPGSKYARLTPGELS